MNNRPYDLIVTGEINADLILSGNVLPVFGQVEKLVDRATLTIGSSSVIFACGAARLGLKVAFVGRVGRDTFGRFMIEAMRARGIDTRGVIEDYQAPTGLSVILSTGGDRAILTHPGTIPRLRLEDIPSSLLSQARHLHLASYFIQDALRPAVPRLFERAKAYGLTISLDPNYDPAEQWDHDLHEALRRADVFLPNATECKAIAGLDDLDGAMERLSGETGMVVVKLGAEGAVLRKGDTVLRAPSLPVKPVDTVGAGDSFDAGFIYGYLSGWPLERSLRLGTVCGAISTQKPGGTEGQSSLEEALKRL